MRVGLFSNAYRPVISGVVNSLDEIRKGLLKRHHTPFLFAPEVKGYREAHAGVFRFPSIDIDPAVEFPFPIPFSARLARLVGRMKLSLIHSHHPILIGAAAATFAKRHQIPLVYTFHTQIEEYSHYVPFFKQQTVKDMARATVRRYLNRCDLIISPSSGLRDLIDSYGVQSRVETVPNAIDLEKFMRPQGGTVDIRERFGISQDSSVSLSVGRLAPEKGLPFLLQTFAAFDSQQHHLVLVGSGLQRESLEQEVAHLNLAHRVHFLGRVDYSEMPSLYAQSDLFVICSTTEVKPLVVLEALAAGVPVLAVSACGTKDTLHHGVDGWLCPLDLEIYSKAWETLLKDVDFRRSLSLGARRTAQHYSMDVYMDRLCELYRETLQSFRCPKHRRSAIG